MQDVFLTMTKLEANSVAEELGSMGYTPEQKRAYWRVMDKLESARQEARAS